MPERRSAAGPGYRVECDGRCLRRDRDRRRPGGYVAAIRAAQLGQKTAVVERDKPGGRCLNYACIPAKTVLHTAELYDHAANGGAELGIKAEGASIDWKALGERRAKVSETLAGGVKLLWDKNKVEMIEGEASLDRRRQRRGRRRDLRGEGGRPRHRLGRDADPRRRVRRTASSTPGAPGRCPSSRRRSPSSAPAPRARRSPPPTAASAPR